MRSRHKHVVGIKDDPTELIIDFLYLERARVCQVYSRKEEENDTFFL